jgi:hypothetical protein
LSTLKAKLPNWCSRTSGGFAALSASEKPRAKTVIPIVDLSSKQHVGYGAFQSETTAASIIGVTFAETTLVVRCIVVNKSIASAYSRAALTEWWDRWSPTPVTEWWAPGPMMGFGDPSPAPQFIIGASFSGTFSDVVAKLLTPSSTAAWAAAAEPQDDEWIEVLASPLLFPPMTQPVGHLWKSDAVDEVVAEFLRSIYALAREEEIQKATDSIYDSIDRWLCEEEFDCCDRILQMVDISKLTTELMRSLLTITFPARDRLPHRKQMFDRIMAEATRQRGAEKAQRVFGRLN